MHNAQSQSRRWQRYMRHDGGLESVETVAVVGVAVALLVAVMLVLSANGMNVGGAAVGRFVSFIQGPVAGQVAPAQAVQAQNVAYQPPLTVAAMGVPAMFQAAPAAQGGNVLANLWNSMPLWLQGGLIALGAAVVVGAIFVGLVALGVVTVVSAPVAIVIAAVGAALAFVAGAIYAIATGKIDVVHLLLIGAAVQLVVIGTALAVASGAATAAIAWVRSAAGPLLTRAAGLARAGWTRLWGAINTTRGWLWKRLPLLSTSVRLNAAIGGAIDYVGQVLNNYRKGLRGFAPWTRISWRSIGISAVVGGVAAGTGYLAAPWLSRLFGSGLRGTIATLSATGLFESIAGHSVGNILNGQHPFANIGVAAMVGLVTGGLGGLFGWGAVRVNASRAATRSTPAVQLSDDLIRDVLPPVLGNRVLYLGRFQDNVVYFARRRAALLGEETFTVASDDVALSWMRWVSRRADAAGPNSFWWYLREKLNYVSDSIQIARADAIVQNVYDWGGSQWTTNEMLQIWFWKTFGRKRIYRIYVPWDRV